MTNDAPSVCHGRRRFALGMAACAAGLPLAGHASAFIVGSRRYPILFSPGQPPPVDAFWSITVYTQQRLLYANPLDRYVINSSMLPTLQRDADGGLTIYVQHESPGAERESNGLPCPSGRFILTLRTYLPQEAIRSGRWAPPPVEPLN
jgi:hypothetical protein